MKAGKVWGETEVMLANSLIEVHRLSVVPNAFCSLHRHATRWNVFYVVKGRLLVEVRPRGYDLLDTTDLGPGQMMLVAPGLWHRFRTEAEGADCLEVYYPDVLGHEDIERQGCGGLVTT
jgi:mannose-6-phosphate isomerase-like protein (cupin superfamily)